MDEYAAELNNLRDIEHGLAEALHCPATKGERPLIRGLLAKVREDIATVTV
jgi:hypothetical protein